MRNVFVIFYFLLSCISPAELLADAPDYKVGFVLSLTGAWSEYGEAQRNALELARQDRRDKFKRIGFIYEDCGHQGNLTVSAFNKLKSIDRVDVLFAWGVQPVEIIAPLAEAARLPMIASAQVVSAGRGRNYVIRSLNYSEQYSKKLLDFLRKESGVHLGLVQAQMSYYDLLAEGLRKNLQSGESLEIIDSVAPDASDFKTTILKARTKSYDRLGLFLTPPQILEFLKEADEQNVKTPVFGMHAFQSKTLVSQAQGRMDGAVYVHNIVTDDFRSRYTSRYGNDNQIPWAANAYDMANLLADILGDTAERLNNDEIMAKLKTIGGRQGAGGSYIFRDSPDTGGYFEYPLGVYKIAGDKHILVWE
jgi:ABC-type branched-subunit amino acid transport system substrate-binding protein